MTITYPWKDEPMYPEVSVPLVGEDGNAFSIIGRVTRAMRKAGIPREDIDAYAELAMSGSYDELLTVTMDTVYVS